MAAKKLPKWAELLIVEGIQMIPASVLAEAMDAWKAEMIDWAKALAASTANQIDDLVVDKLTQALSTCQPDMQFLCDLVQKGEDAVIAKLKELALASETSIDDAAVALLVEALQAA